jgi:hypothetical protein
MATYTYGTKPSASSTGDTKPSAAAEWADTQIDWSSSLIMWSQTDQYTRDTEPIIASGTPIGTAVINSTFIISQGNNYEYDDEAV